MLVKIEEHYRKAAYNDICSINDYVTALALEFSKNEVDPDYVIEKLSHVEFACGYIRNVIKGKEVIS